MNYWMGAFKKYADFSGRATRSEFWYFQLINAIIATTLEFSALFSASANIIFSVFLLLIIIPSISVSIRRLHDTGRSGWWLLLNLIPVVGIIVLIIFAATDSQASTNQYGPNPKAVPVAA